MDWRSFPVVLNNRNRLASLRRMVDWLLAAGSNNVRILDNDSSYPPLLEYYAALPERVIVHRLGENVGPWAFWKLGLHQQTTTPYVVSDADLVPAEFCPADLIPRLAGMMQRFPDCGKVATGLRLDSIAPGYGQSTAARQFESRFWWRPALPGVFAANVDTTFALYAAGADFSNRSDNLRLGYPYLMEHTPWQVDEAALTEEEMYYRAHTAKNYSHWSSPTLDQRIEASLDALKYEDRKQILHLGCGDNYIPGWINLDTVGRELDVEFDLERCRSERLPLPDASLDGVYACHVLNRVRDATALLQELYRVAKPGATLHLRLPHGSSNDAWDDPANVRACFETSFAHFAQPALSRPVSGYAADWQPRSATLVVEPALLTQGADGAMRQIRSGRNLVSDMIVEMTAVKPARPRLAALATPTPVFLTADPRVVPSFYG